MATDDRFVFRIAPHAIEDLGSNLYTSFPRVLAEFIANAYDADASKVEVSIDFKKIRDLRKLMRKNFENEAAEASSSELLIPLADRFLPDATQIEIRDDGFGMTEEDLNQRFLWTARRRRSLEPVQRSKASRPLMGRKGLGKLAGFGVARIMEVVTKRKGDENALKVTLDYDEILKRDNLTEVPVPGGEVSQEFSRSEQGTIIRLRRLAFDAVKSRSGTVAHELSEQFEFIDPSDFAIWLNEHRIPSPRRQFAFVWPSPDAPKNDLVRCKLETEHGDISFDYRIRFRRDRRALPAAKRGIRVYAHNRMAAAPSLFDADTNMHGFRMTDYMDGVVRADFIDDQQQDYIATDRQSLRWDTPLLTPLKDFLSEQIKEACKEYQKVRDESKKSEVKDDAFTQEVIGSQPLSAREKTLVERLAVSLARITKKGVEDEKYRQLLPDLVLSFGQGNLYERLSKLAETDRPDVAELLVQVVRLNRMELDRSTSVVRSRIKAIDALDKEVGRTSQGDDCRNERQIQKLFEVAPWLIDPLYHDYLAADKSLNTTLKLLADALGIKTAVVSDEVQAVIQREPDFFFLLGDDPLNYVVIVEIKASNKPAELDDLMQLREYIDTARKWLNDNGHSRVAVRGELICTPPPRDSGKREHRRFLLEADKLKPGDDHRIRSYTRVLEDTRSAHATILELARALAESEAADPNVHESFKAAF
ncbi:MAG: hypothetical protein GXY83_22540 [Rhodopirellula sp.]|nr:hypothetical protein [Rhodopirellula sp.]